MASFIQFGVVFFAVAILFTEGAPNNQAASSHQRVDKSSTLNKELKEQLQNSDPIKVRGIFIRLGDKFQAPTAIRGKRDFESVLDGLTRVLDDGVEGYKGDVESTAKAAPFFMSLFG